MTEKEIQAGFLKITWLGEELKRSRLLELRDQAKKSGLQYWVQLIDARIALVENRNDDAVSLSTTLIEDTQVTEDIKWLSYLNRGAAYGEKGETKEEIADYTAVIGGTTSPAEVKARARFNRGGAYGKQDKTNEAIADYTAVIEDPSSSAELKAGARINRSLVYGEQGKTNEAIADYTAVIEDPSSPAELKAGARTNRGVAYGKQGKTNEEIADYTTVIEDPSSPAEQKAKAHINRGITYREQGKIDGAIADYTDVIEAPSSPAEVKAQARLNRGFTYGKQGKTNEEIADYTAIIEDPSSPAEQKAKARINRGITYEEQGKTNEEIADYTAVIEDPSSPAEQKAKACINRGITYRDQGKIDEAIADYTVVIEDPSSPAEQKAKAYINRGAAYGKQGKIGEAIADYTAVIEDPSLTAEIKEKAKLAMHFLSEKKPEVVDAVKKLAVEIDKKTKDAFLKALKEKNKRKNDFFSESLFDNEASFLLVLREWNSYTPAIPGEGERVRGGGYFIKHKGTGIVIDPGFDFLEIFCEAGGRLCDIDHIVITHAHNDHTAEFEPILMLLHEFNNEYAKGEEEKKKVKVYLSQGAARKFAGLLQLKDCDYIDEAVTLNSGRKDYPQRIQLSSNISLTILPAYHDDVITQDYSVGLGFQFKFKDNGSKQLLFTSDTALFTDKKADKNPIYKNYPDPFCKCGKMDMLIAHIGSIEDYELQDEPLGEIEIISEAGTRRKQFRPIGKMYEKHLGLKGIFAVLCDLQPKAAIVSEFGEEMRSIWIEAVRVINIKLDEVLKGKSCKVFAGDPVVIYNVCDGKFLCHSDLTFKQPDKLKMRGLHEVKQDKSQGTVRPYLFDKRDVDASEDIAPFEDKIKQFHEGLRNRTLPHFRQGSP